MKLFKTIMFIILQKALSLGLALSLISSVAVAKMHENKDHKLDNSTKEMKKDTKKHHEKKHSKKYEDKKHHDKIEHHDKNEAKKM